jgi:uncharacterized protein YndB with AHSA1/START domain
VPLLNVEQSIKVDLAWRIEAAPARVWGYLTDADLLSQWLGKLVEGTVEAEKEFVIAHGDSYRCRSRVSTYAEPSRLDFTWHFPDEPESKVALVLDGSAAVTDLHLTHSDLGELANSYLCGWCVHLSYLEAAALGTPLPASMFWRLHGTVAVLNTKRAAAGA